MSQHPSLLAAMLALALLCINAMLWTERARAQRRRKRQAMMRRHRLIRWIGAAGTGCDGDPYLRVWERYIERKESL